MDYFYKSIFNWKLTKIELLSIKVFKLLLASILGSNFRTELILNFFPLNHLNLLTQDVPFGCLFSLTGKLKACKLYSRIHYDSTER